MAPRRARGRSYVGYLERVGQGEEAEEERERERPEPVVGDANAESAEIFNALTSASNARLAPRGSVPAGLLTQEMGEFKSLASNGGTWDEVTDLPYDADDPNYRDPSFSNSSAVRASSPAGSPASPSATASSSRAAPTAASSASHWAPT